MDDIKNEKSVLTGESVTVESVTALSDEKTKWLDSFPVLSEQDFYPPVDNRTITSGIDDIIDGDNFHDYLQEYNELCDEEEIYNDCGSDI